jgi:hypothetical protein
MSPAPTSVLERPQTDGATEVVEPIAEAGKASDVVSAPVAVMVATEVRVVPFVPEHLRPRMGGSHADISGGPAARPVEEMHQIAS